MWYFRKHTVLSIPGILLVLLTTMYLIAFIAYIGVAQKRNRLVHYDDYAFMWISFIGLLLSLQALFVISAYRSTNRYLYYTVGWMVYGAVMLAFALCVTAGYGSTGTAPGAVWAIFWCFPALATVVYSWKARRGYMVDRIMGIPEYRPRLADSRGMALFYVVLDKAFPWVGWLLGVFFGLLLVIQALCLANDHRLYKVPGHLVPIQTNGGENWYKLHVWCQGLTDETTPVFVMLTEFGMPSTAMMGLAQGVANSGYPACIVDRPGYGWSEPGYWDQNPSDVVKSINQALTKYPINNPVILVGWGEGGVWAQLYMQVADYTRVVGVVLLDTFPNMEILQTFALNRTTTLQNLRQFRSLEVSGNSTQDTTVVHFDQSLESTISRGYSGWRAASPLALHRARNGAWPGFQPQASLGMHRSLFRNNLYYQAKYFEYGGTGAQLYQALQGYAAAGTASILVYHHWPLRWPAFLAGSGSAFSSSSSLARRDTVTASTTQIPVVIIASGKQLNSDCLVQGITNSEDCTKWQAFAWFYYRQQIEYQQTLSQNAAFLVCSGTTQEDNEQCDTDFVWRRPQWLASALVKQFFSQSAQESSSSSSSSNDKSTAVASRSSSSSSSSSSTSEPTPTAPAESPTFSA
ncbi:hypothetical protein GGI25_004117 [Coemansia spiralis]|uniref:AB hydrolase-1 domain-containing protein n=2 Tax=Coemansia TaxID=4863 RepID=A0A9W8G5R1_9FUNG|nr:hypothetical protein EDC05_003937 [Coemansia umbellata]KAJ2622401.1 hypothetical protein GGI26_003264 [Coemansia sp. RSA 1358]KAJ2675068.1 hypothetical protein GGI25_004117 [Coemansia spiralis]